MFKQSRRPDAKAASTGMSGPGGIPASPGHQARLQSEQGSSWSACCGPHTLAPALRGAGLRAVTHLRGEGWAGSQGLLVEAHIWEEVGQSGALQGTRRGSFGSELPAKRAPTPTPRSCARTWSGRSWKSGCGSAAAACGCCAGGSWAQGCCRRGWGSCWGVG